MKNTNTFPKSSFDVGREMVHICPLAFRVTLSIVLFNVMGSSHVHFLPALKNKTRPMTSALVIVIQFPASASHEACSRHSLKKNNVEVCASRLESGKFLLCSLLIQLQMATHFFTTTCGFQS